MRTTVKDISDAMVASREDRIAERICGIAFPSGEAYSALIREHATGPGATVEAIYWGRAIMDGLDLTPYTIPLTDADTILGRGWRERVLASTYCVL